jgi:hypothetical protein
VHDKQMSDTDTGLKRMKWIKVAPGKWREDAEVAIVQRPKRARALPFNDKKVADFKNWLDFLEHMDHDAYVTLVRYMVGTGVIEYNYQMMIGVLKWYDINIYGLQYSTYSTKGEMMDNVYISHKRYKNKKNLLAAAEANGIKVYKSWSKPRIWKALLSA